MNSSDLLIKQKYIYITKLFARAILAYGSERVTIACLSRIRNMNKIFFIFFIRVFRI